MDLSSQIPSLFVVWIAAAALALIDLAVAEWRGRLAPHPMLRAVLQCVGIGAIFTVYLMAAEAYRRGLIPLWSSIGAVALAVLAKFALDWIAPEADANSGKH